MKVVIMNFCPCRKQKIYIVSLIPYTWLLYYWKQILCMCHFNPIQSKTDSRPTPPYCCFIAIFMHRSIPLWSLSLKHPVQRQRDRKFIAHTVVLWPKQFNMVAYFPSRVLMSLFPNFKKVDVLNQKPAERGVSRRCGPSYFPPHVFPTSCH